MGTPWLKSFTAGAEGPEGPPGEDGSAGGGPRFELYSALTDAGFAVSISDDSAGPTAQIEIGPGLRNVAVDVDAGSDFTDFLISGFGRDGAQTETLTGPGGAGGVVQGTKLWYRATATATPAPSGDGMQAASFYPGDIIGTAYAPITSVDKATVDGGAVTPSATNLTTGAITFPSTVANSSVYSISYRT